MRMGDGWMDVSAGRDLLKASQQTVPKCEAKSINRNMKISGDWQTVHMRQGKMRSGKQKT